MFAISAFSKAFFKVNCDVMRRCLWIFSSLIKHTNLSLRVSDRPLLKVQCYILLYVAISLQYFVRKTIYLLYILDVRDPFFFIPQFLGVAILPFRILHAHKIWPLLPCAVPALLTDKTTCLWTVFTITVVAI